MTDFYPPEVNITKNSVATCMYEINLYFSMFVLICGFLLSIVVYFCLKNLHQNLKFLYFPMLIACFIMPGSNLYIGYVVNQRQFANEFYTAFDIASFSIYFMRSIDCAISAERYIATISAAHYEQKKIFLIVGPMLLIICIVFSLFVGIFVGFSKFEEHYGK